jgi:hypothetical protein
MRIKNPTDFWTGLAFGGFGLAVSLYAVTHYNVGTAIRMGPGYFPTAVGALVAVLGVALALTSLRVEGPRLPRLALRPIVLILAASIVFGYLLKPLGLVLSTILLIIVSAAGGHEFRLREVLVLAAGLTVFSIAVFVYALGLPFPLWPELWNE